MPASAGMTRYAALVLLGAVHFAGAESYPAAGEKDRWSFAPSAYAFFVPDGQDYVQPAFTADRGWAHLEARYNYEDLKTGSVWLGRNWAGGETISWGFTPMLGGVFGETAGVAPGCRVSLDWRRVSLTSEGEYVFDLQEQSDSFFYTWSEFTVSPADWLRAGLVIQRTRAYETERDTQRGFLLAVNGQSVEIGFHLFNPDDDHPVFALSLAGEF